MENRGKCAFNPRELKQDGLDFHTNPYQGFHLVVQIKDFIYSCKDGGTHILKAMNLIFCMSLISTLLGCLTGKRWTETQTGGWVYVEIPLYLTGHLFL